MGAFDDPSLWQELEAVLVGIAALDHFEAQPAPGQEVLHPGDQLSGVAAIGKDAAQPAEACQKNGKNQPRSITILDGGRMHDHMQDQTQRVHQEVSFASQHLLACIERRALLRG